MEIITFVWSLSLGSLMRKYWDYGIDYEFSADIGMGALIINPKVYYRLSDVIYYHIWEMH